MPEFLLRYKVPSELTSDEEKKDVRRQALKMATEIQTKVSELFFGWNVSWEVRELGDSDGQSDFTVTGWVTDNKEKYVDMALKAQTAVLSIMEQHAFINQTVECWWQRVKGKWGGSRGRLRH